MLTPIAFNTYDGSLESEGSQNSLEKMLDNSPKEIRGMIIEELSHFVETLGYQIVRDNIISLLTKAEIDPDVRIRSMARLLKSKVTKSQIT